MRCYQRVTHCLLARMPARTVVPLLPPKPTSITLQQQVQDVSVFESPAANARCAEPIQHKTVLMYTPELWHTAVHAELILCGSRRHNPRALAVTDQLGAVIVVCAGDILLRVNHVR